MLLSCNTTAKFLILASVLSIKHAFFAQLLVVMSDFLLGVVSPAPRQPPGDTSESGDADDEAGADDVKLETKEDTAKIEDDSAENSADAAGVRKRGKVQ